MLTWDGQVARTYYSSSSGGRTESVQDAWPGAAPIPYLRSVSDPYDTYSPHHDWGPYNLSASQLAARLGLGSAVESVHVERDGSSRAESVVFRLASGAEVTRSGAAVARALHLLSDWFSIGELQLSTSSSHVLYGSHVTVAARAAGVTGARCSSRRANGVWQIVRHVSRAGAGAAPAAREHRLPPRRARDERDLGLGCGRAARAGAGARARACSPARSRRAPTPRSTVSRLVRGEWHVVAHPILDSTGKFRTPLPLRPVDYRITVAAGKLAATQTSLHVTRRLLQSLRSQ